MDQALFIGTAMNGRGAVGPVIAFLTTLMPPVSLSYPLNKVTLIESENNVETKG